MRFALSTKKMSTAALLICLLLIGLLRANAQYFDLKNGRKHVTIPFRLIRNMIVIKLKINGKGPFNFVLDTGVGLMLITEPTLIDSIDLTSKITIPIPGLGEGKDNEAYLTPDLAVDIQGLSSHNVYAALLKEDKFNLSNYAGISVQGLLGYEFFSKLAIRINFADSTLVVCRPSDLRHLRKRPFIPITIEDRKAYMRATVVYSSGEKTDSKLVIDIGSGHPILIDNRVKNNDIPLKSIAANLGVGLNGPINGYISRINEVDIGSYKLSNVIVALPDDNKSYINNPVSRDGNLGIEILKKFDVIFDYPEGKLYLKPGSNFNEPFEHDMSGMEYYAADNFTHIIISRVEHGSPAEDLGLEEGDEILSINLKPVSKMTLEDIDTLFKSRDNRTVLLEVYHSKEYYFLVLKLKRRV